MTNRQSKIHKRAKYLGQTHRLTEYEIIEILQDVQETNLYLEVGLTSVYQYALKFIFDDDGVAYTFTNVAKRAAKLPDLQRALRDKKLSVNKAARIVSTLTEGNSKALVEFAVSHSKCELEREVARLNPKEGGKNSVRQLFDDFVEVTMTLPRATYEKMKRAEDVHGLPQVETLDRVYEEHLERNDPVRKAKRNRAPDFCPGRTGDLIAAETHAVNIRDEGQCTWTDREGHRCPNKRWIHIHHRKHRAHGGTNDLNNLTTLCSAHHRLMHVPRGMIFDNLRAR